MNQKKKIISSYVALTFLVISAFMIGDILGYVVLDEKPIIDNLIIKKLENQERVRVIISENDLPRKSLIMSNNEKVKDTLSNKGINALIIEEKSNMYVVELTLQELEELKNQRNIKRIRYDEPINVFLSQSTHFISSKETNKLQILGTNITGRNQTVCVIDTGINYEHESLGGCTTQEYESGNCSKVLGGRNTIEGSNNVLDDQGHGTHVAGIIAANGSVIGVAPDTRLLAVKAFNSTGGGSLSTLMLGIIWCSDNKETYNISVISISAGANITFPNHCDSSYPGEAEIIHTAINKNMSVVVASGNNGNYTGVNFPACISRVIPVTSTQGNNSYASSANRGVNYDYLIAAPGASITSTHLTGTKTSSGTSMATPHVSGVISLMQQANILINQKQLNNSEVKNILVNEGNLLEDSETNHNYTFLQALSSVLIIDNRTPEVEINISSNLLINNTNNYSLIQWLTKSNKDYETNLFLIDENNITLINITEKTGQINLTTNNFTNLGKHILNLTSLNEHGFTNNLNEIYYKTEPLFELFINGEKNNFTGYPGFYNISINKSSGNEIIKINNEIKNKTEAENISLNVGTYNVSAEQQKTDYLINKTINLVINVINPIPIITSTDPNETILEIYENETILFTQESYNPIAGNLTIMWIENNTENISEFYVFNATGKENVFLQLIVINDEGNSTKEWNITINPAPLTIINVTPETNNITLEFNETKLFVFETRDVFNRTINTTWKLNNETKNNNETYLFNATIKETGNHTLFVESTNNKTKTNNTWNIQIMPEPFMILIKNLTDKEGYKNEELRINLKEYFDYYLQGEYPNYELSNEEIPYEVNNDELVILSQDELNQETKILSNKNNLSEESNYFNIKIITKPSSSSSGGGGETTTTSFSIPPAEKKTEEQQVDEEKEIKILSDNKNSITIKEITQEKIKEINFFQGRIYKLYEIKALDNLNELNQTETIIEFEVEKTWIKKENTSAEKIRLYRYNEEWEELITIIKEETETTIKYNSITQGFSYFIIGVKETETKKQIEDPKLTHEEREEIEKIKTDKTNKIFLIFVITTQLIIISAIIIKRIKQQQND